MILEVRLPAPNLAVLPRACSICTIDLRCHIMLCSVQVLSTKVSSCSYAAYPDAAAAGQISCVYVVLLYCTIILTRE